MKKHLYPDAFSNEKRCKSMAKTNLFLSASRFAEITQDSSALAVFLSVASHKTRDYEGIQKL